MRSSGRALQVVERSMHTATRGGAWHCAGAAHPSLRPSDGGGAARSLPAAAGGASGGVPAAAAVRRTQSASGSAPKSSFRKPAADETPTWRRARQRASHAWRCRRDTPARRALRSAVARTQQQKRAARGAPARGWRVRVALRGATNSRAPATKPPAKATGSCSARRSSGSSTPSSGPPAARGGAVTRRNAARRGAATTRPRATPRAGVCAAACSACISHAARKDARPASARDVTSLEECKTANSCAVLSHGGHG